MNIKALFPILDWLPHYNKKHLKGDISAGITVGIMLIPQGMAYAMLAGLPPIYGLYAAIVPQLMYAILGTSRQLGVGPVAMDSLLVAVTVSQFAQAESDQYIALAILLAFMVGAIQLLLGLLRLGFLVNFLSHPVISGFTSAAALIIGFSQLQYLMGVDLERSQFLHEILINAWTNLSAVNLYTLGIGLLGMVLIIGTKKLNKNIPAPLIVVVFGVLVVWFFGLETHGVAIVREVPSGLPPFQVPTFDPASIQQLLASALTIALVAFMEAIAVAKAIHARHKDYKLVPNQELIALGAGNLVGSFFQSFPGTGGFSRSAVNDQAGAKTNLAAIISALFVLLTLLFLTPLFYYLPKAVLASIIMVAVFKLISVSDAINLWKDGHKRDFFILLITFVATLSIGIQLGILVGVLCSIMGTLYDSMFPKITVHTEQVSPQSEALIIHYKEQLYFANSAFFKEQMETLLLQQPPAIKYLLLDGSSIPRIDSTGQKALEDVLHSYQNKGIEVKLVAMPLNLSLPSFSSIKAAINSIKNK
ncbi:MAG: SulP family inorganic anion transporter [Aureispira sp.]